MYVIAEWICRSNERKRSTGNMGIDKSEFDIQIDWSPSHDNEPVTLTVASHESG
jgi:hypothetical protein